MRCEREDRGRGRVEGGAGGELWKGRELPFLGSEVFFGDVVKEMGNP